MPGAMHALTSGRAHLRANQRIGHVVVGDANVSGYAASLGIVCMHTQQSMLLQAIDMSSGCVAAV